MDKVMKQVENQNKQETQRVLTQVVTWTVNQPDQVVIQVKTPAVNRLVNQDRICKPVMKQRDR